MLGVTACPGVFTAINELDGLGDVIDVGRRARLVVLRGDEEWHLLA